MRKIFKHEFMKDIWIMLASFTIMFFYTIIYRIFDITNAESEAIRLTSYGAFFIPMFIIAILFAVYLFSFKNSREKLDLLHSLPISRNKYFLIQYVKGVIYFSITYFVCVGTALVIDLIYYPELTKVTIYFVLYVLKYWLITVLFYSFFVLSSTICAMSIYSILFGIYLIIFPIITTELVSIYCYANYPYFSSNFSDLGSIIGIYFSNDFSSNAVYYSLTTYVYTISILVLLNILLVYVATSLYKMFKTENTASPIGFDRLKTPLVIAASFSVTTFIVLILLRSRQNNLIFNIGATLIILPLVTLLAEFLMFEGFKNIKIKKAVRDILITFVIVFTYYGFVNSSILFNTLVNIDADDVLISNVYLDAKSVVCIKDEDIIASVKLQNDLQNALPDSYFERIRNEYQTGNYLRDPNEKRHTFYFRYSIGNNKFVSYNYDLKDEEYEVVKTYLLTDFGVEEKYFADSIPKVIDYFDYAAVRYYDEFRYNVEEYKYYFNSYQYFYPFKSDDNVNGQSFKAALLLDAETTSNMVAGTFVELPILNVTLEKNGYWFDGFGIPIDKTYVNTLEILKNTPKDFNNKFEVYEIKNSYYSDYITDIKPHSYYLNAYSGNTIYPTEEKKSYVSDQRSILNFNSTDVINGNVDIKVYTGEITPETIRDNNLKIIFQSDSSIYYFGIVE